VRTRQRDAGFVEFVDARRAGLVRTAYLLCGDWHRAEDLVQQALAKLYVAWPKLARQGGEDAYVRRILVNTHVDDWRWRRRRPETSVAEHDDRDAAVPSPPSDDREALRRALVELPAGQRQVVVLRFWLDQSVDQVAADLGVSTGTVKSQTARGLERLRGLLATHGTYESTGSRR
jgi:RNA polymerase sigma-70 factor (sigma-E family)